MKTCLLLLLLVASPVVAGVRYQDKTNEPYIRLSDLTTIDGPLEPQVVVANKDSQWKCAILRTDGAKVAYENESALLQIYDRSGARRGALSIRGFRTVTATWVDDRRLYIRVGIGRLAEVIALYDAGANAIIYEGLASYEP